MKKLNKAQKQFLFENRYVDAKVLDACGEPGWQNYFIDWFDWKLENVSESSLGQKFGTLKLIDKSDKSIAYEIDLIFQDDDYAKLLELAK